MPDLTKPAYHEAGHAVIGRLYGRRVDAVTLRPTEAHVGLTTWQPDPPELGRLADLATSGRHPLDGLPPDVTQFALRRIVSVQAGNIAGEIAVPTIGRQPIPAAERPEPPVKPARPSVLPESVKHAERRPRAEAEAMGDEQIAFEMAYQLVGVTAGPLLVYLAHESRRAVLDCWPVIEHVAGALLAAPTYLIGAEEFERLYQGATRE